MTNLDDNAIDKWKGNKESIRESFRKRENDVAGNQMKIHIEDFNRILTLINDASNRSLFKLPPNMSERLAFIENRPNHYHSFIQLDALFADIEKLLSIVKLRQKSEGR